MQLQDALVDKYHLADSVSIVSKYYKSYIEFKIVLTLSLEGRKSVQRILDVYHEIMGALDSLFTEANFNMVKERLDTKFELQNAGVDMFKLSTNMAENWHDFGYMNIFKGDHLIETPYNGP
jgi:hypothetical protein